MQNSPVSPLVIAVLCVLPTVAWAAPSETAAPTPAPVQISTDYMTLPLRNFYKASAQIAPGKDHDARLLAALRKSGARDEAAPQIVTSDGVSGRISLETPLPTVSVQTPPHPLTSFVQVKPRLNRDGTITVQMTNHRETLAGPPPPGADLPLTTTTETDLTQTNTFTDGQTLLVNYCGDETETLLIFATVRRVNSPPRSTTRPGNVRGFENVLCHENLRG